MKSEDTSGTAGVNKADNFQISVIDEHLEAKLIKVSDRRVNGRQISAAGGFHPASDFVVLQRHKGGGVEDIDLDDLVDLGQGGTEEFFVVRGDRLFKFTVDERPMEWPVANPTEELIRFLTGRTSDDGYELVQEFDGQPDKTIEPGQRIQLGGAGVEKFRFRLAKRLITVFYNHNPIEIERGTYTTEQLRSRFDVMQNYVLALILEDGQFPPLNPDQKIHVKKGMKFISYVPQGNSA